MAANKATFPKWTFTIIMVADQAGGYTAFFAEYPNVVVEGETRDEAKAKLFTVMNEVFEYKRKQAFSTSHLPYLTEKYNADLEPA